MGGLRLVFMGTPDFAVAALDAVVKAGHDVVCVYSQPPRRSGRGHKERPSSVHAYAAQHRLQVRTPASLKGEEEQRAFAALDADVAVVAAYGLILPPPILEAPRFGCINVHASLLPRWRGAAPIQRAILAGDEETGVTLMQMDAGLDTGDILVAESVPITRETTAGTLHDALASLGGRMLVDALEKLTDGRLASHPQPGDGVTYAEKIGRQDARLAWRQPACVLDRQVRAFAPRPGAWFMIGDEQVRVLEAEPVEDANGSEPGTVLDGNLMVKCGQGALRLTRVQRAGKAPMEAAAFLRGFAVPPGTILASTESNGA